MKFPHLEKIVNLMKDLKYKYQSTFPFWGRQIFILRTPATIKVFSLNSQKLTLWCKKNHSSPIWICMTHIWSPTLFPRGIITYQGVLIKFNFSMKFQHLGKNCWYNKIPKTPKHFPLWGRVKLNFRHRYGKLNIYSKNSSCCKVFLTGLLKNNFGIILQTLTHP